MILSYEFYSIDENFNLPRRLHLTKPSIVVRIQHEYSMSLNPQVVNLKGFFPTQSDSFVILTLTQSCDRLIIKSKITR